MARSRTLKLLGQVLFTFLADRYGRKPLMITSCVVAFVSAWPIAYTSNWWLLPARGDPRSGLQVAEGNAHEIAADTRRQARPLYALSTVRCRLPRQIIWAILIGLISCGLAVLVSH